MSRRTGVFDALLAAFLFGAATPLAGQLAGRATPQVLAGLLYLGSGIALGASMLLAPSRREAPLARAELPALTGAIVLGGGVAPLLLMVGLQHTSGASASLLLNLEVVFTAVLAWTIAREPISSRVAVGLGLILAGGVVISWQPGDHGATWGAAAIVGACVCWGLDNNLTQTVSAKDPRQIAALKGLLAGGANLVIGLIAGGRLPDAAATVAIMSIGVLGYGLSLMLFVTALRMLGTARTGSLFAVAPFAGVVVAIVVLRDPIPDLLAPALGLMAVGVWLHVSEHHEHEHTHHALVHSHAHRHDDGHHDHSHDHPVAPDEVHSHEHDHASLTHAHAHRPDIHHRHRHLPGRRG